MRWPYRSYSTFKSILSNKHSLPRLMAFIPSASNETFQDLSLFLPHPLPLPRRYMIDSLLETLPCRDNSLGRVVHRKALSCEIGRSLAALVLPGLSPFRPGHDGAPAIHPVSWPRWSVDHG